MASTSPSSSAAVATGSGKANKQTVKAVFLPADTTQPVQEWTLEYDEDTAVSCVMNRLQAHFSKTGVSGAERAALRDNVRRQYAEALQKQQAQAASSGTAQAQPPQIDEGLIDQVLNQSSVDSVPLQNGKKTTNFIALNMYVDDQGSAKKLPVNVRASQVCAECGHPLKVLGDALIARYFDDDNDFRRIDFTLQEFSSADAQWKAAARAAAGGKDDEEQRRKQQAQLHQMLQQHQSKFGGSGAQIVTTGSSPAPAAAPAESHTCARGGCGNPASLRCARCKRSYYCGAACQKADWKYHKVNLCTTAETPAGGAAESKAKQ